MAYNKKKKQTRAWYDELCIGVRKVVKVGASVGIIIPKGFIDTEKVKLGQESIIILQTRQRRIADELTKEDLILFEEFKKKQKEDKARYQKEFERDFGNKSDK